MEFFVLGEEEIVIGFRFVGIPGEAITTAEDALAAFRRATGQDVEGVQPRCRVLILTENVSSMIEEDVVAWQYSGRYPLVVEIPGLEGHLRGRKTLVDSIREAIGIQV